MAQRTQMRLHAITGSLSAINSGIADANVAPVGSSAAFAENMLEAMGHIAGAIKRIHGNSDFLAEERGKFTHATSQFIGVLSASSDILGGRDLDIDRHADIAGTSDLHGAVHAYSTLLVDGNADFKGDLVVTGALKVEDLTPTRLVFVGADDVLTDSADLTFASSELKINGAVSGSGNFTVGGTLEVNGTSTLGGNLTIEAGSDLIVQDLVATRVVFVGASDELVDDAEMTYASGVLTVSGSTFSKDVTIAGNLTVQGDQIIANTTTVQVEDKNLQLGKIAAGGETDSTAADGGITLVGATNHSIIWRNADGGKWEFSEHLVPDGAKDLGLTGDRWTNLWLSGNADVDGTLDVASTVNLAAPGVMTTVRGTLNVDEAVDLDSTLNVDGVADFKADVYMAQKLYVSGAADLASTLDVVGAVQMDSTLSVDGQATFSAAINLDQAADQSILKTGGDLYVSASSDLRLQAGGLVKLADQYTSAAGSTWGDAEGIKLSNSAAEWANFEATFGAEVSLLAALTGGGSGGKFVEAVDYSGTIVSASLLVAPDGVGQLFSDKWPNIVEPRVLKTDVFVNGQLMVSGSGMDYLVDGNGDITFSFGLVPDDMVVVKVG